MKVLIFGRAGQVATELQEQARVIVVDRRQADLSDPAACAAAIEAHAPDGVINAAAYTNVDKAEEDEARARQVNGEAPGAMARMAASLDIPFIQISTDYVFSGEGHRPWKPTDTPAPQNAYGRTKLLGEEAVRAAGGRYAILRTSWVFSAYGNNFLKTMLRLGVERDSLTVVGDQIGGPTPAAAIAAACLSMAQQLANDQSKSGTYHLSGREDTSWADFARQIMVQAGFACHITDIPTTAYPTLAKRPLNSRMDCHTTETVFGIFRPNWKSEIGRIINQCALIKGSVHG